MSYQANIPQASQLISDSQADLLDNFIAIQNTFDVNHADFNDPKAGKHNFVQFPNQAGDPGTAGDEVALYTKAVATVSQLFYQAQSSATPLQVSNVIITSVANSGTIGGNISFFDTIFGIRVYAGTTPALASGNTQYTIVFPTPYSTILTAITTANDPNAHYVSCASSTTKLTIIADKPIAGVNFFAIGRI